MARRRPIEIIGTEPWPAPAASLLGNRGSAGLRVLVTPSAGSLASVAERYPHRDIVVLATDPSAVEAALLIYAGADAYVVDPADLRSAADSLHAGEAWLSPVAATAVSRLARLTGDPTMDLLAAFARAVASGQPWPSARRAFGLTGTRSALAQLRQLL